MPIDKDKGCIDIVAVLESFSDREDCLTHSFSYPDWAFAKKTFGRGAADGLKSITMLGSDVIDIEYYDRAHQEGCVLIQKQVISTLPRGAADLHVPSSSIMQRCSLLWIAAMT